MPISNNNKRIRQKKYKSFATSTLSSVLFSVWASVYFENNMMFNPKPKPDTTQMYKKMIAQCEAFKLNDWDHLKPLLAAELDSFTLMLKWIKQMKDMNEITLEQARIHIDIQRNTMRTRLTALPGMDLLKVEHVLNQCIDSIRMDIYSYVGWVLV